ncbi:uncharacterized protein IWZ02DRAFT_52197 [Phyllosticta citriasiana]|uniref:uncharacterized protein n=1 Tax=Phyllosticta citriasiana TaxID=595635 RepID=UPI0030FDCFA8
MHSIIAPQESRDLIARSMTEGAQQQRSIRYRQMDPHPQEGNDEWMPCVKELVETQSLIPYGPPPSLFLRPWWRRKPNRQAGRPAGRPSLCAANQPARPFATVVGRGEGGGGDASSAHDGQPVSEPLRGSRGRGRPCFGWCTRSRWADRPIHWLRKKRLALSVCPSGIERACGSGEECALCARRHRLGLVGWLRHCMRKQCQVGLADLPPCACRSSTASQTSGPAAQAGG